MTRNENEFDLHENEHAGDTNVLWMDLKENSSWGTMTSQKWLFIYQQIK